MFHVTCSSFSVPKKNSKQIIIQTSCQGTHSTICQNSHLQFLSHLNSIFFHMYFGASIFTAQFLGQVLLQVFGCHESPRPIRLAQVQLHKKAKGHDTSHHTCVERRLEAGVLDLCGWKKSSKTSPLRNTSNIKKYILEMIKSSRNTTGSLGFGAPWNKQWGPLIQVATSARVWGPSWRLTCDKPPLVDGERWIKTSWNTYIFIYLHNLQRCFAYKLSAHRCMSKSHMWICIHNHINILK